jgi:hypothetical protein
MAKLSWDANGERIYGAGVDRGVFYPSFGPGIAWSGLVAVNEVPSGKGEIVYFIDGEKKRNRITLDSFAATIEAFTYPDEFDEYDGFDGMWRQQSRKAFNFSYRTLIGDGWEGLSRGYNLHLVYNAMATPSARDYETLDENIDPITFGWDISTKAERIPDLAPTAHILVDTTTAHPWTVAALEDILYGTDGSTPRMPSIEEVIEVFESNAILRIIDHGDGTWTATGPDEYIQMIDGITFEITYPTAEYIDEDTYQITSL